MGKNKQTIHYNVYGGEKEHSVKIVSGKDQGGADIKKRYTAHLAWPSS